MKKEPSIGFIGAGRVASHLAAGLSLAGYRVVAVASRTFASAEALANKEKGCVPSVNNQAVADTCDLVFITTPDDAIPAVAAGLKWRPDQAVVHCSGADSSEVLEAAKKGGAVTGVFHPLQTFANRNADLSSLRGITFSLEAEEPLLSELKNMAKEMGGKALVLKKEDKPLYHAAAVIACNYMVALTKLATDLWATFGVGDKEATAALMPLMKGTLANIESTGLPGCLTGPIARGDIGTVRKHLASLHERAPGAEAAYRVLGQVTLTIAEAKRQIDNDKIKSMAKLLSDVEVNK